MDCPADMVSILSKPFVQAICPDLLVREDHVQRGVFLVPKSPGSWSHVEWVLLLLSVGNLETAVRGSFLDRDTTASDGDCDLWRRKLDPKPDQDQAHVLSILGMKHTV